ncbi:shTK domain protein [Ancylostoma caninum]|uniref:ShTK domain protein n=1 Tax=Ancylostoma caninum TaxID=29170 RepID=A0A368GCS5_ANCCA|nr:shTK domain protein [Ancylostoma caninum]
MKHIIPVAGMEIMHRHGFQARPTETTVFQPRPPAQIPANPSIPRLTDTHQTPVTQAPFIPVTTTMRPFQPQQQMTQQVFQPQTQQITFFRPEQSQNTFRQTNTFTAAIQTRPSAVPSQFQPMIPDLRRPTAIIRFCFDRDGVERCADWVPYCRSERFYAYMRTYCARSCGFC